MSSWSNHDPEGVDTIVKALAKPMKDRVPAGHHGLLGGAVVFFGVIENQTPLRGAEHRGRRLGRPAVRGRRIGTVSVCQGDVRNGSIEGIELKCPVVVESRELRPDSCGAGKFRGGLGIDMRVRNLVEGKWNFEMPRRGKCPPWGIRGGTPGEPGGYLLKMPGERKFTMRGGSHIPVPIGAEAIVRTGGGGGWGKPQDRDPRWSPRTSPKASFRLPPRASSTAWRSAPTCRSTKPRLGRCESG
jgi:N-methylhydantoinase B